MAVDHGAAQRRVTIPSRTPPRPRCSSPAAAPQVDAWVSDVTALGHTVDAATQPPLPERLAQLHNTFERIHPFLDGNCGALGELVARAMLDNLNRFIVPSVAGPARLVPRAALAGRDVTLEALRHAARRGRLDAVQGADGVAEFPQGGRGVPGDPAPASLSLTSGRGGRERVGG